MKGTLLDEVSVLLLRHGFTVKSLRRGCFDVVARKDNDVLLVKALEDANSIGEDYALAMRKISGYIDASPVIVAKKAGEPLEDGVVYARFGVHTLSLSTMQSTLDSRMPFILSSKAGLKAAIEGESLKRKREELGYSLGELSRKVGVSKKMITRYETGQADVSIGKAYGLYKLFGSGIFRKIDVLQSWKEKPEGKMSILAEKYTNLGFEAGDTEKAPFDVVAKLGREIILTDVGDKADPQLLAVQKLLEANTLVIFKKEKPKKMPALTKKEFLGFESAGELIRFLKEY